MAGLVIDDTLTTCKKQELQIFKKRMHQLKKMRQKNIVIALGIHIKLYFVYSKEI